MKAILDLGFEGSPFQKDLSLLELRIAGRALLERQLLVFREAGFRQVQVTVRETNEQLRALLERCAISGIEVSVSQSPQATREASVWLRGDTLVDPRLLQWLTQMGRGDRALGDEGRHVVLVDRAEANYDAAEKSPFRVGVPEPSDLCPVVEESGGKWYEVGLKLLSPGREVRYTAGRYYWHRVSGGADARPAEQKILFATMKATDGLYARTNRRVSYLISGALMNTAVTPNMVTAFAFSCSVVATLAYAQGSYAAMVVGGLLFWCSSMLDGVDGELARARFQASDFGCWFEMVCDYLSFVILFAGMGVGLYRSSGEMIWLGMGLWSSLGSALSFGVVGRQRKLYSEERGGSASGYGVAFKDRVAEQSSNPIFAFAGKFRVLATRAGFSYYIALFTILGLSRVLLSLIFTGTTVALLTLTYSLRLFGKASPDTPGESA